MEITQPLDLSPQQLKQLELHSVLNILNILTHHLLQLSRELGNLQILGPSLDRIQDISAILHSDEELLDPAEKVDTNKAALYRNIEHALSAYPHKREDPQVQTTLSLIDSVTDILEIRARELITRKRRQELWNDHSVERLYQNFFEVFSAIQRNSGGSYRIVYDPAQQDASDYLVELEITGQQEGQLRMPAVFQDVLRDLLANARKYTSPGGRIAAQLREERDRLLIEVSDTGRGIPQDELENIVSFGNRGRNVQDKQSYGGGFGLTKAYFVTRQFNGRMWIASELGSGTRITITVPKSR